MKTPQVSAIVPAYNEAEGIETVLKLLIASTLIDEVLVVNDGSTDNTAAIVNNFNQGVKLINLPQNQGKADALLAGASEAKNEILFFCDADLIGLNQKHLEQIILPVKKGETEMTVGSQEHMAVWPTLIKVKKKDARKIKEFTKMLGGERALKKEDFLKVPNLKGARYGVEQSLVNYFVKHRKPYQLIVLKGVGHTWKLKKWGLATGLKKEVRAMITLVIKHLGFLFLKITQDKR